MFTDAFTIEGSFVGYKALRRVEIAETHHQLKPFWDYSNKKWVFFFFGRPFEGRTGAYLLCRADRDHSQIPGSDIRVVAELVEVRGG